VVYRFCSAFRPRGLRRQGKKPTIIDKAYRVGEKQMSREKKIIACSIDLWDGKPIYVITFDIYV